MYTIRMDLLFFPKNIPIALGIVFGNNNSGNEETFTISNVKLYV